MKKLKKSISENFPPVRIYLDDLERIAEIFSDISSNTKFTHEGYEYDSLTELINNKGTSSSTKSLTIYQPSPYISLEFDEYTTRLYSDDDNRNSYGTYQKIKDVLNKRISPIAIFSKAWFICALYVVLWTTNSYFNSWTNLYYSGLILTLWIILLILCAIFDLKYHSVIYLVKKNNLKNIFVRNKDQIFVALISAILGAAFMFLFSLWTKL